MNTTSLECIAILGLLLFGLGLLVSLLRGKYDVLIGHPAEPTHLLHKAVRAHGNTAEYAPLLAVLFLALGALQPSVTMQWVMIAATASRVLIVLGILFCGTLARPHPVRFLGALGTYVTGLVLTIALGLRALGA